MLSFAYPGEGNDDGEPLHATDSRSVRGSGARTQRWVRRAKTAQALVLRARIVLQTAAGKSDMEVAGQRDRGQVAAAAARRLRWLAGRAAPGSAAHRRRGAGGGLETIPAGATHWSTRSMAKACGLSAATVSRIWRAFGLKPHRCETFKLSRDPLFIEKVRDVVGLYLHPPERAVVAWTRSRRFKRWSAASRYCRCVQASQSGAPTTTAGTEPPRCLRPWTCQRCSADVPAPPGGGVPQVPATSPKPSRRTRHSSTNYGHKTAMIHDWLAGQPHRPRASWINQVERSRRLPNGRSARHAPQHRGAGTDDR